MEYNTTRNRLLMPEYGRNVQKMIEFLLTIDDREKRIRHAEAIIDLMGTLNPQLKMIEDYRHKLWDHLYQMTDFKLDVDSPYPRPTAEIIFKKPERIPYPQSEVKVRHLGKNVQALFDKALTETNEEKKHGLTQAIGYYMKLAYANWHKEPVHDDMIRTEISVLTNGQLKYESGGYRIPVESIKPSFKPRNGNGGNGNNNRNFKGNNAGAQGSGLRNSGGNNSTYGNGFGKNKKYKNKSK